MEKGGNRRKREPIPGRHVATAEERGGQCRSNGQAVWRDQRSRYTVIELDAYLLNWMLTDCNSLLENEYFMTAKI